MIIRGKAIKFGDNVDTDVIIPGQYLALTDPREMAKHAMEGLDPDFTEKVGDGAIIVAGKNFGCGSSREQAPLALKHAGVKGVLAESIARIFYRNAITIGLPVLECPEGSQKINEGDQLVVNLEAGKVKDTTKTLVLRVIPLPEFMMEILEDGGLIEHLKGRMKT